MFNFALIDPATNSSYVLGLDVETDPFSALLERNFGVPSFHTYLALLATLYGQMDAEMLSQFHPGPIPETVRSDHEVMDVLSPASGEGQLSLYVHGNTLFIGRALPEAQAPQEAWITFQLCPDHAITLTSRTLVLMIDPQYLEDLSFVDSWRSLDDEAVETFGDLSPYLSTGEGNAFLKPLPLAAETTTFSLGDFMWITPAEATGREDADPAFPVAFTVN